MDIKPILHVKSITDTFSEVKNPLLDKSEVIEKNTPVNHKSHRDFPVDKVQRIKHCKIFTE